MNPGVDANLGYLGERARLLRDTFARFGVEYMFIGKGAALAQGFPGTTRDLDIFPAKGMENRRKLLEALRLAGFTFVIDMKDRRVDLEQHILEARDFVKLFRPFELDIVFAPDGFESYEEAAANFKVVIDGYPLLSIGGIITSKRHANRPKDQQDIPLLEEFRKYLEAVKDES